MSKVNFKREMGGEATKYIKPKSAINDFVERPALPETPSLCKGGGRDVVLLRQGRRWLPSGIEPATSGLPSATTTNYAKEQLGFRQRG